MAVSDIRNTTLAEATIRMLGRKNKLAECVTTNEPATNTDTAGWVIDGDEVSGLLPSRHPVGGLSEDGGANVCDGHLFDPLLDPEASFLLSLLLSSL